MKKIVNAAFRRLGKYLATDPQVREFSRQATRIVLSTILFVLLLLASAAFSALSAWLVTNVPGMAFEAFLIDAASKVLLVLDLAGYVYVGWKTFGRQP